MLSSLVLLVTSLLAFSSARKVPDVEYDAIVVGGGPSGLSATSALCRMSRKVIMFDNEEYRNALTRNMHDVIGNDGKKIPPACTENPIKHCIKTCESRGTDHLRQVLDQQTFAQQQGHSLADMGLQ